MNNKLIAALAVSSLMSGAATASTISNSTPADRMQENTSPVSRCGSLVDYTVGRVSFPRVTAREAVSKLLVGTPLQATFTMDSSGRMVSAKNVSGNLDQVLRAFGKQAGLSYSQARCVITFSPKTDTHLSIEPNDVISERLAVWLAGYGYSLAWEAEKYQAAVGVGIDDGFEETLTSFKESMRKSGVNLTIQVYENNLVRVTESK